MYIERNEYLEKLKAKRWNGQIKVITGLRRSGKSFLLFNIFRDYLISSGVKEENIITLALDDIENIAYTDPFKLNEYIKSRITSSTEEYYVLIDEIQYAISSKSVCPDQKPADGSCSITSFSVPSAAASSSSSDL